MVTARVLRVVTEGGHCQGAEGGHCHGAEGGH